MQLPPYSFHADHFQCATCKCNLLGQQYGTHEEKFYCARDFGLLFAKTCEHCGELIEGGQQAEAMGKYYHPEHFCCCVCGESFPSGQYYCHDNQPYCQQHYGLLVAPKCNECRLPLLDAADSIAYQGIHYHVACVKCYICGVELTNDSVMSDGSNIFCQEDYWTHFGNRCETCSKFILDQEVQVDEGQYFHIQCLTCTVCNIDLTEDGQSVHEMNGSLRCEEHSRELQADPECDACGQLIQYFATSFAGKKYHEQCFKCSTCDIPQEKKNMKMDRDDALLCLTCFHNKYSDENTRGLRQRQAPPEELEDTLGQLTLQDPITVGEEAPTPVVQEVKTEKKRERKISYRKGKIIGRGAAGIVYLGMDDRTGELIAVKEMILAGADKEKDRDLVEATEKEIQICKELKHKYIVQVLGTDLKPELNNLCILMEYVPGTSMWGQIEQWGPMGETVIRKYTKQMFLALQYMHGKCVMHRDIKARNVLITPGGSVKLCDFGSAREFDPNQAPTDDGDDFESTPLWASPEACNGIFGPGMDVWATGCVVIEMATAKTPWEEKKFENAFRAMYHICHANDQPPLPPNLSETGLNFLRRVFTLDHTQRPNATELLSDPWFADLDAEGNLEETDM